MCVAERLWTHHQCYKGVQVISSFGCRVSALKWGKHFIVIDHRVQSSSICKCIVVFMYIQCVSTIYHAVYNCVGSAVLGTIWRKATGSIYWWLTILPFQRMHSGFLNIICSIRSNITIQFLTWMLNLSSCNLVCATNTFFLLVFPLFF